MAKGILLGRGNPWGLLRTGRTGRQWFGLNDHFDQGGFGTPLPTESALAHRNIGSHVIRDCLNWRDLEPAAGVYNFGPSGHAYGQALLTFLAQQRSNSFDTVMWWIAHNDNPAVYTTDPTSPTWRGHLSDAMINAASVMIGQGQAANMLVFCLDNEPNSSALAMAPWYQGSGNEVTYTKTCQHMRSALKAYNSSIRVAHGEMIDGDHPFYGSWRATQEADSGYFAGMDILSNHLYSDSYPAIAPPEVLFNRCEPYFAAQLTAAAAAGRSDITTAITECGTSPTSAGTQVECDRQSSRLPFLYSLLPGLEFCTIYAARDNATDFWMWHYDDPTNWNSRAIITAYTYGILNVATARSQYADTRGGVIVKMTVPDANGGTALAVWNTQGNTSTTLSVTASQAGNMNIYDLGGVVAPSAPPVDVKALAAGGNNVTVRLGPAAKIITSGTSGMTLTYPALQ